MFKKCFVLRIKKKIVVPISTGIYAFGPWFIWININMTLLNPKYSLDV